MHEPAEGMIGRVVRILGTFDSERTVQTASEISRRSGLPMSTTHRVVADLRANGLLEGDERGGVRIGMRLWELTTRGSRALRLREVALPHMGDVQRAVRQHTQLGVLEDDEVLFLERLSHPAATSNITRIAGRLPLHASSSGLVLLAHGDSDLLDRVLARPLTTFTADTPADEPALRRKLSEVRRLGHAVAEGYIEPETAGLAVPVRAGRSVVAAISVVVPRDTRYEVPALAALRSAAEGIAADLATPAP